MHGDSESQLRSEGRAFPGMDGFFEAQAEWSRMQFGPDSERGPLGPLKHLRKEVNEAIETAELLALLKGDSPEAEAVRRELLMEIVDGQFLVFDAGRRAGFTYDQILAACWEKLAINKTRKWNKPTSDEPVEHIRHDEGHGQAAPKGL